MFFATAAKSFWSYCRLWIPVSQLNRLRRWRVTLEESRVVVDGHEISVTMSVGVASFNQDGVNFEEVLGAADKAMYLAKARGRNCTVLFSNPT